MNGENLAFTTNPRSYLERKAVICYTATGSSAQKQDLNRIDGNTLPVRQAFAPTIEFDLVRNPAGYVDLKMLGGTGTYAGTSRRGKPIVGNYIPYLGQKDKTPLSSHFGRIDLSQVTTDYVFTFTFSGCNFVVTTLGTHTYVYHEPTSSAWSGTVQSRYPGETYVGTYGPAYDATHDSGFGCLVRDLTTPGRWNIYAQTPTGVTMTKAALTTATIDV